MLVVGLGPLLKHPSVQAVLQIVGGVMLIWTAASMIVALVHDRVKIDWEGPSGGSKKRAVFLGIVSSLANPYWMLWWATIGLGLITKAYALGFAGFVAFYLGHITGDLTWYSLISGALAAGKRFITPRVYRTMLSVAAAFLIVLAAWFLTSGLRTALG